jgi:MFS family permease
MAGALAARVKNTGIINFRPAAEARLAGNATTSTRDRLLRPAYRNYVLAMITVGFTLNFLDRQILSILMQPIKQELRLSDTALGFLSGLAFAIFYATLGIPVSRLADRGSRQWVMALSMGFWSLATAACGLAHNFSQILMARVGVGIGEAGFTPSGLAMLADYFSRAHRGLAIGIANMGLMFGTMLGLLIGGWAASTYGWRSAFMIAGLPGVIFAILFWLTVREPWRDMADGESPTKKAQPALFASIQLLWRNRTYRYLVLGGAMSAFGLFGISTWMPSFLARSHGMSPKDIGTLIGPLIGLVGGAGMVVGGYLSDKLSRRDERWIFWMPAAASVLSVLALAAALLVSDAQAAIGLYAIAYFLDVLWIPATYVTIQSLVPTTIRASATAWKLLFTNLIGLGLGPQLVGVASDFYAKTQGSGSLRSAMLLCACSLIVPTILYLIAAVFIRDDLAKAGV